MHENAENHKRRESSYERSEMLQAMRNNAQNRRRRESSRERSARLQAMQENVIAQGPSFWNTIQGWHYSLNLTLLNEQSMLWHIFSVNSLIFFIDYQASLSYTYTCSLITKHCPIHSYGLTEYASMRH